MAERITVDISGDSTQVNTSEGGADIVPTYKFLKWLEGKVILCTKSEARKLLKYYNP